MDKATRREAIENKLVAARTRLILNKPFLGALVLRLPLQAADPAWCPRTFTDAKTLFYNPGYIEALDFEQVQFALSSQALHCALSHFNRRGHREEQRWATACDFAVNLILADEGLRAPPDAIISDEYRGMTAEEIYPLLETSELPELREPADDDAPPHNDSAKRLDRPRDTNEDRPATPTQRGDSGQSPVAANGAVPGRDRAAAPQPLSATEKDALQQKWQQRLAGAAQRAQQAGKLGEGIARMIELFLQPRLPWRAVLARYMNSITRDDYSYARPSSRRGDPAIFPSLRSAQVDLVVAVDVSGSIGADELNEFMAEIDALKSQVRARVTLLACDSKITEGSPWIFESWECCRLPAQVVGSGSTDFAPVFEWVENQDYRPDLLIYFTDAQGLFPKTEPAYPALWLVKGQRDVPWGQRIQLN
ncbi:MAG: VWA-like domain-containing protein [Gammaproteobacteria bacterium]|nr:VWA-like domain-containing protein [Gammaproteobacteria bacterium]